MKITAKLLIQSLNRFGPDSSPCWDNEEQRKSEVCFILDILKDLGADLDCGTVLEGVGLDPEMD